MVESGSKTGSHCELTDDQWEMIEELFPWEPPGYEGGRPRVKLRECLDGVLWVPRMDLDGKNYQNTSPRSPPVTCGSNTGQKKE